MSDAALVRLAEAHGVATSYVNWQGTRIPVSVDTLRHVLTALGVDVSDPEAALRAHQEAQAAHPLPPAVVTRAGHTPRLPLPDEARTWVELADGGYTDASDTASVSSVRTKYCPLASPANAYVPSSAVVVDRSSSPIPNCTRSTRPVFPAASSEMRW